MCPAVSYKVLTTVKRSLIQRILSTAKMKDHNFGVRKRVNNVATTINRFHSSLDQIKKKYFLIPRRKHFIVANTVNTKMFFTEQSFFCGKKILLALISTDNFAPFRL